MPQSSALWNCLYSKKIKVGFNDYSLNDFQLNIPYELHILFINLSNLEFQIIWRWVHKFTWKIYNPLYYRTQRKAKHVLPRNYAFPCPKRVYNCYSSLSRENHTLLSKFWYAVIGKLSTSNPKCLSEKFSRKISRDK